MNTILFVGEHARTYNVHWHDHEVWELVYCTGGEGVFKFVDGQQLPYKTGDAVAIPPSVRHANYSDSGFTNLHLTMDAPSFPYREAFRVCDDSEGHLKNAFREAKFYYLSDLKRKEGFCVFHLFTGSKYKLIHGKTSLFQTICNHLSI